MSDNPETAIPPSSGTTTSFVPIGPINGPHEASTVFVDPPISTIPAAVPKEDQIDQDEPKPRKLEETVKEHRALIKRKGDLLVAAKTMMTEVQSIEDRLAVLNQEIDARLNPN
jgi:hypothetical protein